MNATDTRPAQDQPDDLRVTMSYRLPPQQVIWLRREAKRRGMQGGRGGSAGRVLSEIIAEAMQRRSEHEPDVAVPA